MKKVLLLALLLSLTACAAPPEEEPAAEVIAPVSPDSDTVKLGLAAAANIAKSMHATGDFPGYARTEMTFAAVLVDGGGVIRACAIDGISASIPFDETGTLLLPNGTVFLSKTELGQDYGMHKASPLGTEWYQQAADFAAACVGKTTADLQGGDTVASVTISTDALLHAVTRAAESARADALAGDTLLLTCRAAVTGSHDPLADGTPGLACLRAAAAAAAIRGGAATAEAGCAVVSAVPFTDEGRLACDISPGLSPLSDVLTLTAITPREQAELVEISLKN